MRGASGQHGQLTVSGEMLNRAMMLGNWLTKSSSATLAVKPSFGTNTNPPRAAHSSSSGFLFGNQHTVAMGEFHLHIGNAGARCRPRCVLNWKLRDAGEFPQPCKIA